MKLVAVGDIVHVSGVEDEFGIMDLVIRDVCHEHDDTVMHMPLREITDLTTRREPRQELRFGEQVVTDTGREWTVERSGTGIVLAAR